MDRERLNMAEKTIKVRVPGTTANCGPGFDTLGAACTIYNDLELTLSSEPGIKIDIHASGRRRLIQEEHPEGCSSYFFAKNGYFYREKQELQYFQRIKTI